MTISKLKPTVVDVSSVIVCEPRYGDLSLNLHPLDMELPPQFQLWSSAVEAIRELIPHHNGTSNRHFVTITSRFFSESGTLRREGVHIDGNFCADPEFSGATWGGTTTTWAGTTVNRELEIKTRWVSPYGVTPPLGRFVSSTHGGIFVASSAAGCSVWTGHIDCVVGNEGSLEHARDRLSGESQLSPHRLYFMSSDTPHESLEIQKGTRRTLIRVTLAHDYPNNALLINKTAGDSE